MSKTAAVKLMLLEFVEDVQGVSRDDLDDATPVLFPAFRRFRDWLRENGLLKEQMFYWNDRHTVKTVMSQYWVETHTVSDRRPH